jgi:hypothetical protein
VYLRFFGRVMLAAELVPSVILVHQRIVFHPLLPSYTRWLKYDWDYLCVNKSQFVPVIFEPPCIQDVQ